MHFLYLFALALLHESIKEWGCSLVVRPLAYQRTMQLCIALVVRPLAYQRSTNAQCIVYCVGSAPLSILAQH